MVRGRKKDREKKPARQAFQEITSEPNKIGASTPYQFNGRNLTAYGGLLPVATMLEKLEFQALVEETITCGRETRVMSLYKFILGIVLGLYIGFPRLNQLRFIARDPMLTGILNEPRLPPQSTLWRFLASLHLNVAAQILKIQRFMRQRVWQGGQTGVENGDSGHRYDRAHALRQSDGGSQELQPEKQGQEELPADADLHCRNAGIRLGGVTQRRPSDRQTGQ